MERHDEVDNVVPFPVANSAAEVAAVWLVRLDKGLTESDRAKLSEWLREHPDNGKALHELAAFWGDLDLLAEQGLSVSALALKSSPQLSRAFNRRRYAAA